MHIIHNTIGVPKISYEQTAKNEGLFIIKPLPSGYGVTLGNAMRRVMLSSIPWARVTGVKMKGVSHEYTTVPGIKDSVLDMLLNIKGLVIDKSDAGIEWVYLRRSKAWVVTAGDIQTPAGITILNSDHIITEIDRDGFELDMSLRVEKGVGYMSMEELKSREDDVHTLLLDANFSPVTNVRYDVANVRYADMTDLDSLEIAVSTNGVLAPRDALWFASNLLVSYFGIFNEEGLQIEGEFLSDVLQVLDREKQNARSELDRESYTPIEIIGLSPRTLNALVNADILSVEQLTRCTEAKLSSIKGFGRKAMNEVRDALQERGYRLLWDE